MERTSVLFKQKRSHALRPYVDVNILNIYIIIITIIFTHDPTIGKFRITVAFSVWPFDIFFLL